jgi:hypothetical protein
MKKSISVIWKKTLSKRKIGLVTLCLFYFISSCNTPGNKEKEEQQTNGTTASVPIRFKSPDAAYKRDSLFIAATVWQFIYKQVSPFHYYTTFDVPFDKITIDVDSIFYSPDSLKIFAFVIETDPDVQHKKPDKYVYSGNALIGFRSSKKTYWTLYNSGLFSIAGLENYNDVRNSFRKYYLGEGRFKTDWHYYWDSVKQDYVDISFGYNIDDARFWDSSIVWKKRVIPGYYSFQTKDQAKPGDENTIIIIPHLDYPDSLLRMYN